VGGAWQQFSFCEAALAWVRQGDLRHAASLLFRPAAAAAANDTDGAHGADAGAVPAVALRWQSASATASAPVSAAEAAAAKWGGFGLAQVLSVARSAAAAVDEGGDEGAASSARVWGALVALSHAEERLALAFTGAGADRDAAQRQWLREWVRLCCLGDLHNKVAWVADKLCRAARRARKETLPPPPPPPQSSASSSSSSSSASVWDQAGALSSHALPAQLPASSQGWSWLDACDDRAQALLEEVLLPAVGSCCGCTGTSSSLASQSLLAMLDEGLEFLRG